MGSPIVTTVIDQIADQRVVPVIRSSSPADAVATARACARAGMRVIELTHSVPNVDQALLELRDDDLTLGVGTITDTAQVDQVVTFGARFVVSYFRPSGFVERAQRLGITAIPGAFTPSEVVACVDNGARVVKIFPARLACPEYLRDLRTVLPDVRMMVTGGVTDEPADIAAWLDAGAVAVGVGSTLGTVATMGDAEVERRARVALLRTQEQVG